MCRSILVVATLGGVLSLASAQTPSVNPQNFTEQYCLACHDDTSQVGGISFESVDWNNPGKSAEILEKALRKVGGGEMPPPGMPRPTVAGAKAFTGWLADSLDKYAAAHPNPGRPAIHRLNRAEYSNAIRDLLSLDTKPGDLLPVDDSGYGFDNIGDILTVSPVLMEKYLGAAESFAVTYGDGVTNADLAGELAYHLQQKKLGTVLGINPPSRFGEIKVEGDRVVEFAEKPDLEGHWINGGFFFFHRDFCRQLSEDERCMLEREPLAQLARNGQLNVFRHRGFWASMDTQRDREYLTKLVEAGTPPWLA